MPRKVFKIFTSYMNYRTPLAPGVECTSIFHVSRNNGSAVANQRGKIIKGKKTNRKPTYTGRSIRESGRG